MGSRLTWLQIRERREFKGRWVALDECRYDTKTSQPVEGSVVDSDEDLVTLCNRMQESDNRYCAIVYCDDAETAPPPTVRRSPSNPAFTPAPGRPYTH